MVKLSIIILNYNTKDITLKCIESVVSQYKKDLKNAEVELLVADNGSKDGSAERIKASKFISFLTLLENEENLGFTKGNNRAAKYAKGRHLLFLNSDTYIKDQGFLKITDFLNSNPKVGIVGGKLTNNDGSLQRSAGKFYNLFNILLMLLGMERIGFVRSSPSKISRVDWVSGACLMIRRDLFEKLSGFDENYFMYMEDMDLCFRAKNRGFLTYFYPDVKLIHIQLGSSNRTFAIKNIYKGLLYFYMKHGNFLSYSIVKSMLYLKAFLLVIIGRIINNRYLSDTYSKALKT
ncbi:MAG: hypothetical protein A2860_04590 [Candidatus Levybacteria bacterium RIFCSPHIGHO2_01_FULL_37_33]|nr:MAG: hypothetical protein A2860_04590 [Candidatus Levybacteria bacterium RIFCSPHIGHO2_01_FULL_37_33]OGH32672.1 MAG: hypothetical protein A2953_00855 [Candidatus Levybacteria bacterium RIFCSPLOWO2_01_FULL_36_54]